MPFVPPPAPKAAETLVWRAQPSPAEIAEAEGVFGQNSTRPAKGVMRCYVRGDGKLEACTAVDEATTFGFARAVVSLADRYRLDNEASGRPTTVKVSVDFPKLYDTGPQKIVEASGAERRAVSPDFDGVARLQCRLTSAGLVSDCKAQPGETLDPKVLEAAAKVAATYQFKAAKLGGRPTDSYLALPIVFNDHVLTNPDWERKPSADEFARLYPDVAIASGLGGQARMRCQVAEGGLLKDCLVLSETPPGVGFGDAVLKMASKFKMRPMTRDGKPVGGAEVVIPVNFRPPAGVPKVAPNAPGSFKILPWAPWIEAPSAADVAAAMPAKARGAGVFGNAAVRCELKPDGHLRSCESSLDGPDPMGFGRAAISLTPKFRAALDGLKPSELGGYRVAVSVSFSERTLQPAGERHVRQPEWLRAPDAQTVINAYPDKAVKAGVLSGKGVVDCLIGATGMLEGCTAKSQEPEGLDFGLSAVKVASIMQANLWTRDGEAAAGQHVLLPLRFIYRGEVPAGDKPPAAKPGG